MSLPNNPELLSLFSSYLSESGLSAVSIKNYLSDLRHFLSFCNSYSASHPGSAITTNAEEVFRNLNQFLVPYTDNQKATLTPQSTTNRRLASIRRFSTFLSVKFDLPSLISDQYTSNQIVSNSDSTQTDNFFSADHTVSPDSDKSLPDTKTKTTKPQTISTAKILEQFKRSLEKEKKTHSTIKNYISDLNHFFLWTANQTPDTTQNLQNILSENQLNAYITYLKLSHTSTSVINRRGSSIKKLTRYCHEAGFISLNPFELKAPPPQLSPLAWMERLSRKPKRLPNTPKNRLTVWYDKYTALPWTPYLNIALLILLTTGMAIFAYNQIITQARPGAAATALTPPRRQLSFQGRLTDSSGTPISTAVNVEFRLYDEQAPGGSQLYTTNACSITPDQDGIFNTFIGDGTCGTEIPIDVFTDNRDVFLEIQVGAETLTPRQQIATVGFALNSETLQGYPASAAATINTVPVVDNNGDINIAATSPSIVSSDGTFSIVGQSIAIQTAANSGGDVILQPDALGSGQILALGGTTDTDTFRITNSNLTTGSLLSGYVGNDQPFGALINLSSGASESSKFYVMTDGRTSINASATDSAFIVNQAGSGNVISASVSGSPVFTVTNSGDVDITGQYLINGSPLSLGAGGYWQRNAGALSPIAVTDPINLGSNATASALVHLAGTAGDNSFINTASFGIGTTTPDRILDVESTSPQLRLTYTDGSVYSDIYTNSTGALVLDPSNANNIITLGNGGSFSVSSTTTQLNHTNGTIMFQNATINTTSGTANPVQIVPSFTPSSGTLDLNALYIDPVINQSGSATGNYTALKINVTETNALGSTNYLAQFGKNNTYLFNIDNNGNVGIGTDSTSSRLAVLGTSSVSTIGASNLLTADSGFDSGTGWTPGSGWSIGSSVATHATGNTASLNGTSTATSTSKVYQVNFSVGVTTAGSGFTVSLGGQGDGITYNTAGAKTTYIKPSAGTGTLSFTPGAGGTFVGTIDTVSIYEVSSSEPDTVFINSDGSSSNLEIRAGGSGLSNTSAGTNAGKFLTSGGNNNSFFGNIAGNYTTIGDFNTALGSSALTQNVNGSQNTAVGARSLYSNTGTNQTAVGYNALYANTTGYGNTGIGSEALKSLTSGLYSTAVGYVSQQASTGNYNTSLGSHSLYSNVGGTTNVGIGYGAGYYTQTGSGNTFIGYQSGWGVSTNSNSGNTFLGYRSGFGVTTGSNNLLLGYQSGDNLTSGARNIALGYDIDLPSATSNNQLTIGNLIFGTNLDGTGTTMSSGSIGIGTTSPDARIEINHATGDVLRLTYNDSDGSATAYTDFNLDSSGDLTINSAGGNINLGSGNILTVTAADIYAGSGITTFGNAVSDGTIEATQFCTGDGETNCVSDFSSLGQGANYWQRNDGALSPLAITDPINLGNTATSSALVHLAGTAGDNSFINNGFFGIGLNNPAYTLDVTGNINLTGALYDNGNAGTPGQILSSTGTGVEWIDNTGSGFQHWLRNDGLLYPTITTDDIAIGGTATSSALFHISGTTGAASSSSTLTFRGGADPKINILNGENFGIQTSLGGDSGLSEKVTITNSGRVGINSTNPDPTAKLEVNTSGDYSSTLTTNYTAIVGNSSVLANYTLDSSLISDYSVVGVLGVGSRPTTNGYAGYGVIGIGEGGWGESVGGLFEATSYDAVPAYGLKTKATSYTGSTAYGVYIEDTLGAGTNYGLYQAGTNDINYFAGSVGIGTLLPLATFDLRGNSGTTPTASISGNTTSAALIVDQSGTGDLFTASSSGQTRFSISNTGLVYISSLGTGVVKSTSGVLSSGAIDLSTTEVTGLLPLARGGTNNNTYTLNEILIYDGSKIASSGFTTSSFETPLTFSNGLTRTLSAVTWGGTLTQTTNIDMNGNDITFTGAGNVGIGVASPSGKFDVSGVLVVDSVNGRVGIGTSTPAVALDIAGTTSTISNSAGDITFNSASDIFNFSGDSLDNILNATISGQIKLGNFPTVGLPTSIGTGSLVFDSTTGAPKFWNGGSWQSIGSFLERTATGILYPSNSYDSLNIGGDPSSSASALIRLSSNTDFNTFFINPVAIGFSGPIDDIGGPQSTALQIAGDFLPDTTDAYYLGDSTLAWKTLYLSVGINDTTGTQLISIQNKRLTGGTPWNIVDGARIGDTSNTLPSGIKLYVANGGATISGTLGVVGDTSLIGNVTVGGGTGKIDVGTVDPPYTINGQKYGTYMAGMIGIKEEVMGKVSVTETIPGLGYRALIDLDGQTKGSDLWLFGKTTNIKENIHNLAVLLTAEGQGKTWYEIDTQNKILAVYSSTPSEVTYRLTAPRFDAANWSNNRTSESVGFVINDPDININTPGTGLLNASISAPELLAQVDNHYKLSINGAENKEISSFSESIIANLKVGAQVVFDLVAENLTIRTKLISPIADIDLLKVIDATISGTLYANDIKGRTIDTLTAQINLLDEKYATASSILADLQNKYSSYDSLLNTINIASPSSDPLNPSPLATTSATLPSDLTLDTLSVQMVLAGDILTNGSVLAQSFSSLDTDLFIQPTGDKPVHILANLMTLFPDGKVLVNGDLLITGTIYANAIDTRTATVSGTLALGKGEISTDSAQLIALFDDNGQIVGSVDASGSASFGKLVTGGLVIASGSENSTATVSAQSNTNTTIGTATIATGSSEITVASSKVTDSTLIYITPISNTDNNVLYVKSKQSGLGFTVAVPAKPNQVTKEISFNYWLVETK